jgi:hypothetical protein
MYISLTTRGLNRYCHPVEGWVKRSTTHHPSVFIPREDGLRDATPILQELLGINIA